MRPHTVAAYMIKMVLLKPPDGSLCTALMALNLQCPYLGLPRLQVNVTEPG